MRIFRRSSGPVVSGVVPNDHDDAIRINDTLYGLGAGVWSRDGNTATGRAATSKAGRMDQLLSHVSRAQRSAFTRSASGRENHKMMLDHCSQTKRIINTATRRRAFTRPRLRAHRSVEAAQYSRNRRIGTAGSSAGVTEGAGTVQPRNVYLEIKYIFITALTGTPTPGAQPRRWDLNFRSTLTRRAAVARRRRRAAGACRVGGMTRLRVPARRPRVRAPGTGQGLSGFWLSGA